MARKIGALPTRPRVLDAPKPNAKVAICVPSMGAVEADFAFDLARLCAFTGTTLVADGIIELVIHNIQSSILPAARNDLAKKAIMDEATHVLWLDSDMRFPRDLLLRLLQHNKPIVGCNYSSRKTPPRPITFTKVGDEDSKHEFLYTREEDTGLVSVEAIGFGAVLIQTSVFLDTGYPAFQTIYDPVHSRWVGEDVYFCEKAKAAGHTIWVDHDLSKDIAHIGKFEFTLAHAAAMVPVEAPEPSRIILPGE